MKAKLITVFALVSILGVIGVMAVSASPNNQRQVIRDLFAFKITVVGNSGIDMIGNVIDLDSDNDTSINADTDDQIDFEAGGTDIVEITANGITNNKFNIATESAVATIAASGTITLLSGYQPITSTAELSTSNTSAIADGSVVGQSACIVNENASDAIHILDAANTNLSGKAILGNDDVLCVLWDGADWLETSQIDN